MAVIFMTATLSAKRELVDKIVACVNESFIAYSDLMTPHIAADGEKPSLDMLINQELWCQKATMLGLQLPQLDAEKRIVEIKNHHGWLEKSDEEFQRLFKTEYKITPAQYRMQLQKVSRAHYAKSMDVQQHAYVDPEEVRHYYEEQREKLTEPEYRIAIAQLKDEDMSPTKEELSTAPSDLVWQDMGWFKKDALQKAYHVITSLTPEQITKPIKGARGYVALKLLGVKRHEAPSFEESYVALERTIREQKITQLAIQREQELRKEALVIVLP